MPKEFQLNGKWYWELEPKGELQLFSALPEALMWQDQDFDILASKKILVFCRGQKKSPTDYPFIAEDGNAYAHAALLSSEHEKKSRRCTTLELAKWCDKNGFWIFVENLNFYAHDSQEHDLRTKERLIRIIKSGMQIVGDGEFGYPGIVSGLYIERVWSYSNKDFEDYMQWAKELIAHKQQEGGNK